MCDVYSYRSQTWHQHAEHVDFLPNQEKFVPSAKRSVLLGESNEVLAVPQLVGNLDYVAHR